MNVDIAVITPQQQRSEATQRRILDAVAKLLDDGRYQDATVQEIIRLANCSVGAFYGRFKDKNAALYVFYDERCSELERLVERCLCPESENAASLIRAIDSFVEVVVQQMLANAPILRASSRLTSGKASELFWIRAKTMNGLFFKWVEALLHNHADEHTHPEPRVAALYVTAIIGSLARDNILVGARLVAKNGGLASFKNELKRAVFGYLGCAI